MAIARLFVATLLVTLVASQALARRWTDSTGKHSIEGEFLKLADGWVEIRRTDGKSLRVPLDKLCADDQKHIQELGKPATAPSPFVVVEDTEKKPESEPSRLPADKFADAELRAVVAIGHGTTEEDAKANALQNAVQQAIGVLVDAATVVENDKLLSDKVLTYSNGYVERYEQISSERAKGLITIKIAAQVKVQALSEKLRSLSISVRQGVDGSSLAAAAATKGKRDQDATAMLKEVFQGFPANCLALTTGSLRTGSTDVKGKTDVTVPVTVTVDSKRYQAFDSSIRRLLNAMAVRQQTYSLRPTDLNSERENRFAQAGGVPLYSFLDLDRENGGLSRMCFGKPDTDRGKTFGVALYDIDRSSQRTTYWTVFELDQKQFPVFRENCSIDKENSRLKMSVKLLDAEGKVLDEEEFLPLLVHSQIVPRAGKTDRPPVLMEGVRIRSKDYDFPWVCVTLNLMNPGLTEGQWIPREMRGAIRGSEIDRRRLVPLMPIAPLFHYDFTYDITYYGHGYSPEVRLAVTFKGLEVGTLDKVKKVECSVYLVEQAEKTSRE